MSALRQTTTLSDGGHVDLPKSVRERRGWAAGDRLIVEDRPEGVLITREAKEPPEPLVPPIRIEDVSGMLRYRGPPRSIEDMNRGVEEAAAERFERSRSRAPDG